MPAAWVFCTDTKYAAQNIACWFFRCLWNADIPLLRSSNKLDGMARPTLSYRRIVCLKKKIQHFSTIGPAMESGAMHTTPRKSFTLSCQSWIYISCVSQGFA